MRAYSSLHVKSVSEDAEYVYIEGIASTPTPDRSGDVVNPMGARFKTPMPLLLDHKHDRPVGQVTYASPTPRGIPFRARLPVVKESGLVKDRVDQVIHSLKHGLIFCVSVGFSALKTKVKSISGGGSRYDEWDWHELSLCTVGANSEALITSVKSLAGTQDEPAQLTHDLVTAIKAAEPSAPAASGRGRNGVQLILKSPGASGTSTAARRGIPLIPNA